MSGKSVRVFLVDGAPTGLLTAEIGQWTGKALVCPRQSLNKLGAREEAQRAGVYVLQGPDPEQPGRDRVYVGEAENLYQRLKQHDSGEGKDFWARVCLFASSDQSLTKAHVKYLESRLVELAYHAKRAIVDNSNTPPQPRLPEADIADMEQFLDQAQILLPVLGFSFAKPLVITDPPDDSEAGAEFELKVKNATAYAQVTSEAFVVRKGSTANRQGVSSWTSYKALRDKLLEDGTLVPHETDTELYVFTEDYPFNSPSAAAAVVNAGNASGPRLWKHQATGQSYGEWQTEREQKAEAEAEA